MCDVTDPYSNIVVIRSNMLISSVLGMEMETNRNFARPFSRESGAF